MKNDFVRGGRVEAGSPDRGSCDMLRNIGVVTKALRTASWVCTHRPKVRALKEKSSCLTLT